MKILGLLFILSVARVAFPILISETANIINGKGVIRTRNFLHEYGKPANSTWIFTSYDWQNFALVLNFRRMRLFYWDGKKQICLGSYNLTINGDQESCLEFAEPGYEKRYVFFNSPTCANVSSVSQSERKTQTEFPLRMKYESDGRTINGVDDESGVWGFEMDFEFVQCPDSPSEPTPVAVTTLPDITTVETLATVRQTTEADHQALRQPSTGATQIKNISTIIVSNEETVTTQKVQSIKIEYLPEDVVKVGGLDVNHLTIIVEVLAGCIGLIAVILILTFGCKTQRAKRKPRIRRPSEAPLYDRTSFDLPSPSPQEEAFVYSVHEARSYTQCSDDRTSNQYASIRERNWSDAPDYATMAQAEERDGNAIYASVTFNPNINEPEIAEYAAMTGCERQDSRVQRARNNYEDRPRNLGIPVYSESEVKKRENSLYVKMIVTDEQNNNEYEVPTCKDI